MVGARMLTPREVWAVSLMQMVSRECGWCTSTHQAGNPTQQQPAHVCWSNRAEQCRLLRVDEWGGTSGSPLTTHTPPLLPLLQRPLTCAMAHAAGRVLVDAAGPYEPLKSVIAGDMAKFEGLGMLPLGADAVARRLAAAALSRWPPARFYDGRCVAGQSCGQNAGGRGGARCSGQ